MPASEYDQDYDKYCVSARIDVHFLVPFTYNHCHLMAVIDYSSSFQNSLMAASAAAAYCFQVYYCHENHLFHPAKGAPQKRDDLHRKRGTLLVPLLRCPPSILMGNGGGTPPPPSLFTGAHFGFHLHRMISWAIYPLVISFMSKNSVQ